MQFLRFTAALAFTWFLSVGLTVHSPVAAAVILNIDDNGQLTGAENLQIGDAFFNVAFRDGTCVALYGGCDSPGDFDFTSLEAANNAAQALLDQVFINSALGRFDSVPGLSVGCSNPLSCTSFIPYALSSDTPGSVLAAAAVNFSSNNLDGVTSTEFARGNNTGSGLFQYALFSSSTAVTSIPEPASFLMFTAGLMAVAGMARRNRRQNEASAGVSN